MRVLLDTNIIIHREAAAPVNEEIGVLFNWLDRLHYAKCLHPIVLAEIQKHQDPNVVAAFRIKLKNYQELKTLAPETSEIEKLRQSDKTTNDRNDTSFLKEVFSGRVDFAITEDRGVHAKAKLLGIADRVFTIDDFLEKVIAENPESTDYPVLSVRKKHFGNLNLADPFFDSFKRDYCGFGEWFGKKADEIAYVCESDQGRLLSFLYVKPEDEREPYNDISPQFTPKRRLKIGTFKVTMNGFKLGERFLKIIFDNALVFKAQEIYATIFSNDPDKARLIAFLSDWGFKKHGVKRSSSGEESVLVRDFSPVVNTADPKLTYPFMSARMRKFIVPIYPRYHTELLPDSILRTESPEEFVENRPNRNAIRKVYISRSIRRDLAPGDLVLKQAS